MHEDRAWAVAALLAVMVTLGGCGFPLNGPTQSPGAAYDLLEKGGWGQVAGTEVHDDGSVVVAVLDRRIVEQDGSAGQANPPVNLRGPRVQVDGDFSVAIAMNDIGAGSAHLHLYADVPVVYDEWCREPPSLRLGVQPGEVELALWDGTSDDPDVVETFNFEHEGQVDVVLSNEDGAFSVDEYRRIAGSSFSILTPENDFKPQFVQPRRGVFAFDEGDALVEFAEANDMAVHGHTLVWHEAIPQWMRDDAVGETMDAHVDAVAGHYRGRVAEWDVVNEPMSDEDDDYVNGNLRLRPHSPWFESMGEGYIDRAFRRAHEADPEAKLFINEYGVEEDGPRWEALLALVERLVERGVPIDGVGFQNHEYQPGDRGTAGTFGEHVAVLAELGLEVRVSEMDVLVHDGEEELQAEDFAATLRACLNAENCTSFSTWGFTDRYGSTAGVGDYPPELDDALPWDAEFQPKQAHRAMMNTLESESRGMLRRMCQDQTSFEDKIFSGSQRPVVEPRIM